MMEEGTNSTFQLDDVYSPLPQNALPPNTVDPGEGRKRHLWDSFMKDNAPLGPLIQDVYDTGAKHEKLFPPKVKRKRVKSRVGVSSGFDLSVARCRRRASKITTPSAGVRYKTFVPLRDMWNSYIDKLVNLSSLSESSYPSAAGKLMKADLHGCPVVIQKSRCPSYIGVSGIVIQETRNMFVLITREDQVKRIPKSNSVFSVVLGKFLFSIHGNQFIIKPGDRAGKKFKTKATLDL